MDMSALRACWLEEERAAFQGWDFSHLNGRLDSPPLPWDYAQLIRRVLLTEDELLDMGTGGGEFLLTLEHPCVLTHVTESYPPNIQLCQEKLAPLGIDVQPVSGDLLPFEANLFDLVINRHESYDLQEVSRVLKPGKIFLTQQVGEKNNQTLSKKLIPGFKPSFAGFNLASQLQAFQSAGFEPFFYAEAFSKSRFFDVGAVVYYAKALPWEFPNFSVENNFSQLAELQKELDLSGFIESDEHRFILAARNQKGEFRHAGD